MVFQVADNLSLGELQGSGNQRFNPSSQRLWNIRWEISLPVGILASVAIAALIALAIPALSVTASSFTLFGKEICVMTFTGIVIGAVVGALILGVSVNEAYQAIHGQMNTQPAPSRKATRGQMNTQPAPSRAAEKSQDENEPEWTLKEQRSEIERRLEEIATAIRQEEIQIASALRAIDEGGPSDLPLVREAVEKRKELDRQIRELEGTQQEWALVKSYWDPMIDEIVKDLPSLALGQKKTLADRLKTRYPFTQFQPEKRKIFVAQEIQNYYAEIPKVGPGFGVMSKIKSIIESKESYFQSVRGPLDPLLIAILAKHQIEVNLEGVVAGLGKEIAELTDVRQKIYNEAKTQLELSLSSLLAVQQTEREKLQLVDGKPNGLEDQLAQVAG